MHKLHIFISVYVYTELTVTVQLYLQVYVGRYLRVKYIVRFDVASLLAFKMYLQEIDSTCSICTYVCMYQV